MSSKDMNDNDMSSDDMRNNDMNDNNTNSDGMNAEQFDNLAKMLAQSNFENGCKSGNPDKKKVCALANRLLEIIFPGYFTEEKPDRKSVEELYSLLNSQICLALEFHSEKPSWTKEEKEAESRRICKKFFEKLPDVKKLVKTDIEAAYDGDPAAKSYEEIILAYPGITASTISRIAHELYLLDVPIIPRMMTEYAHSATGIDIHPGAVLGKYFFIDHGTGIVIGETSVIGDHVKIYQGVTIGALSTRGGQKLAGVKRHPTIENNVTIYSGASVLGGKTVIGENSVIGGNVFITSSIPANTRVSNKIPELDYKTEQ